ncbi:hypothetical protein FHT13_001977 [Xanthomonas arboricola]|nr:hypothetical protein [Xanthomonas arboricola]
MGGFTAGPASGEGTVHSAHSPLRVNAANVADTLPPSVKP